MTSESGSVQANSRMAPCNKSGNHVSRRKERGQKPKAKGGRLFVGEMSPRAPELLERTRPGRDHCKVEVSQAQAQGKGYRTSEGKKKNTKRRNFARGPRVANGGHGNEEATPRFMLFLGLQGWLRMRMRGRMIRMRTEDEDEDCSTSESSISKGFAEELLPWMRLRQSREPFCHG